MNRKADAGKGQRAIEIISLLTLLAVALFGYACCSSPPETLGVRDGRLSPCPSSPNCVSSFDEGDKHVEPLKFKGAPNAAMARVVKRIAMMDGATLITQNDTYLHVEFRTSIMRFVDDVELLLDAKNEQIHIRSASRRGYRDLGVNRERVNPIRTVVSAPTEADEAW